MSRICPLGLISVLALTFAAGNLSASTITYEVGTCVPGLPSFPTITAALAATPAANLVMVCPGTYREQVQITQPVTLEGVSTEDSAQAIIAPPVGGLTIFATPDLGGTISPQLWVNNASGPVNISDLTVDGSMSGVLFVVGIFYQNSSGTVNRVATRNQSSGKAGGVAIWAEGGSSDPLVIIENSSVHDYADLGILVETRSATPKLTAVIKGNELTTSENALSGINAGAGIDIDSGTAVTVTSNLLVNPGSEGISAEPFGSVGSISANIVVKAGFEGIKAGADGISVSSNKIFRSATGIVLGTSIATIQSNSITDSNVAIDFSCSADPNVHSNIITDAGTALNRVPSAVATSNTYFSVGTIRTGGCL